MNFLQKYPKSAKVVKANFIVSFLALAIGGFFGFVQGLHRTDVFRGFMSSADYYTALTGHGVLLALIFTTFFIMGLFQWGITSNFKREPENMTFTWVWFWLMVIGLVMTAVTILAGFIPSSSIRATVLYTFYPPLQAYPTFYIGLALVIVATWMAGADWFWSYRKWRKDHPEKRIPLQGFMVMFTMLMWYICTIGVTIEVVGLLIPWSLGWVTVIDPILPRTLFWYFGHALVYFWLLPAYFIWYSILPKLSGGRLFSDSMTRIVFILFLMLSTPVGFHHQFADPGISVGFKFYAMATTMLLLLPSLMTLFTVVASMEHGARQRGGKGYFKWLLKLPWDSPAFVGCALGGIMFAAGGFSGMVNASMNINLLVHNTIWIPGHFHLTVGTATALSFMAVTYWLLPQLTGRKLKHKTMALIQPYSWFLGMTLMSNAMHREGLSGVPRRTAEPTYTQFDFQAIFGTMGEMKWQIAIGGTILFISLILFLWVIISSWRSGEKADRPVDSYLPKPLSGVEHTPAILDNMALWFGLALVLAILAYIFPLWNLVKDGIFTPGALPRPSIILGMMGIG